MIGAALAAWALGSAVVIITLGDGIGASGVAFGIGGALWFLSLLFALNRKP